MLASLARGRLPPDAWDKLQSAARRDACAEGVASAFNKVSNGPRMKAAQPAVAAEFLYQAARFLDDVLEDDLGAAIQLERALVLAPAHADAFAKMETILGRRDRPDKLAELYAIFSTHLPRGQQALMLRRAAEWLERAEEEAGGHSSTDKAIEMWHEIVRLEPGDDEARSRLESLYVKAGMFREAVRLNEQSLAREPAPDEYSRCRILERIVTLHSDSLEQPERAIAYVEQLLGLDPRHAGARAVAERLLAVKGLVGRAAAALAQACETESPRQVERYICIELEGARGSRRTQLLARLGHLREDRLDDGVSALEAYDQLLAIDPTDEETRSRYVAIANRLGCHGDAVRVLERVAATVKDPSLKLRVSLELGETLLAKGEAKRAKPILVEVLESLGAPPDLVLRAARALSSIYEATYERRALCDVLDRVASLEDDAEKRREANERLAAAALKLKDSRRATEAYERLLSSSARAKALEALDELYRGAEQREKYARLLVAEADTTADLGKARALMMRAAQVRAREAKDVPAAIATLQKVLRRCGSDREVLALLVPLLESEGRTAEAEELLRREGTG
jgi:tetratricopeptide (TPR) repeat protein